MTRFNAIRGLIFDVGSWVMLGIAAVLLGLHVALGMNVAVAGGLWMLAMIIIWLLDIGRQETVASIYATAALSSGGVITVAAYARGWEWVFVIAWGALAALAVWRALIVRGHVHDYLAQAAEEERKRHNT